MNDSRQTATVGGQAHRDTSSDTNGRRFGAYPPPSTPVHRCVNTRSEPGEIGKPHRRAKAVPMTGGQVVAGSNPVSPTKKKPAGASRAGFCLVGVHDAAQCCPTCGQRALVEIHRREATGVGVCRRQPTRLTDHHRVVCDGILHLLKNLLLLEVATRRGAAVAATAGADWHVVRGHPNHAEAHPAAIRQLRRVADGARLTAQEPHRSSRQPGWTPAFATGAHASEVTAVTAATAAIFIFIIYPSLALIRT